MQTFIAVEDARALILKDIKTLPLERINLSEAVGRTLAETITATTNAPPFDNSARDGYAVRWEDVKSITEGAPCALIVVEHIAAGHVPTHQIAAGQAARIMTGAPMPTGADTVVMREYCEERSDDSVTILDAPSEQGQWVRTQGSFVHKGQALLCPGDVITPGDVGVLASFGYGRVNVTRRPRVGILSTGDELAELGQPLAPGQIINSNTPMLAALVEHHGGEALTLPQVPDEPEKIFNAFERALLGCDLVISSGGASVGDHDHVANILAQLTQEIGFWKIRMKPGKPLIFGTAKHSDTPLVGLPGNPVSSFVCFHQFVRPAMARMQGKHNQTLRTTRATLTTTVKSTPKRREYLTGRLHHREDGLFFEPVDHQDSGNLRLLGQVNAFGIVPEGVSGATAGNVIEVELL